jgi:hypothetical protein
MENIVINLLIKIFIRTVRSENIVAGKNLLDELFIRTLMNTFVYYQYINININILESKTWTFYIYSIQKLEQINKCSLNSWQWIRLPHYGALLNLTPTKFNKRVFFTFLVSVSCKRMYKFKFSKKLLYAPLLNITITNCSYLKLLLTNSQLLVYLPFILYSIRHSWSKSSNAYEFWPLII